jgi:hypothetical protein
MHLCLILTSGLMSTAIPVTQPVITHSSAVAAQAADISSMSIANPRQYVYIRLKKSLLFDPLFLDSDVEPSNTKLCPKWGDGLIA